MLDGIDLTPATLRTIELKLNGYLSFDERINQNGEEFKEEMSDILPMPKAKKDDKLHKGTFDLLIHL